MKVFLTALLLGLFAGLCFAQDASIEAEFNTKKKTFKLERRSEGEDASSGSDYLVYKDGAKVVKIRSIWSSSAGPVPRVEDFYFANGKLVLFVKATLSKKLFKSAVKGNNVALKIEEKLWFKDDKLTAWIENGKTIDKTDTRWNEREKEAVEAAKNELESYDSGIGN